MLNSKGDIIKTCIYNKGLLYRKPKHIKGYIQDAYLIKNCIIKACPHKHFDPYTIVFDTHEKAHDFLKRIFNFQEWKRNNNTDGRKGH